MKKQLLTFLCLFFMSAGFHLAAQGYHAGDVAVLKAIRDNAPASSPLKTEWGDDAAIGIWAGVVWDDDDPRRVIVLQVDNKQLTSLNVTGLTNLKYLYVYNNEIPLSGLPLPSASYYEYAYAPQNKIFAETSQPVGQVIDFSSQRVIDGAASLFKWYKNGELITGTTQSGKYQPNEAGWYNCEISNVKFPGLTLTTHFVKVGEAPEFDPAHVAILKSIRDKAPDVSPLKNEWLDGDSPGTWANVSWDNSRPKKVIQLSIVQKSLTELDVRGLTTLQFLNFNNNKVSVFKSGTLPQLIYLYCSGNSLTDLKLSGFEQLYYLNCSNNRIATIDLTNMPSLGYFQGANNVLQSLDLSGVPNLYELNFSNNLLETIDLSGLSNLQTLTCNNNRLSSLDVRGMSQLIRLYCQSNLISSLDLEGLNHLQYLNFSNNMISNVDLTDTPNLLMLAGYVNRLTTLDVTGLSALQELNVYSNKLTALNISGCPNIRYLSVYSNHLSTLDLSGQTSLVNLYAFNNSLTSLTYNETITIQNVLLENNRLSFTKLLPRNRVIGSYSYSPQQRIFDEANLPAGSEIDYSGEAMIGGIPTSFSWFINNNDTPIPGTDQSGKFTPTEPGYYTCQMINESFPGLTLTTSQVNVGGAEPLSGQTCTTALDYGPVDGHSAFGTLVNYPKSWYKVVLPAPINGIRFYFEGYTGFDTRMAIFDECPATFEGHPENPAGAIGYNDNYNAVYNSSVFFDRLEAGTYYVALYSAYNISTGDYVFYVTPQTTILNDDIARLIAIRDNAPADSPLKSEWADVSKAYEWPGVYWDQYSGRVYRLDLRYKKLTSLDVSGFDYLSQLDCSFNSLTSLNLGSLGSIYGLYCQNNLLTSLDLQYLPNLQFINCSYNLLTSIDVAHFQYFYQLIASNNRLSSVKVAGLTRLDRLDISYNQIRTIDLTGLTNLRYFYAYYNQLTSIDFSGLSKLQTVSLYYNNLTSLKYDGITKIATAGLYFNALPFSQLLPKSKVMGSYSFNPQNKIFTPRAIYTGTPIDYTAEAMIDGAPTTFVWYWNGLPMGVDQTGLLVPMAPGKYFCRMTNPRFSGLTLTTYEVTVYDKPEIGACGQTFDVRLTTSLVRNRFGFWRETKAVIPYGIIKETILENLAVPSDLVVTYSKTEFQTLNMGLNTVIMTVTDPVIGASWSCEIYINVLPPLKSGDLTADVENSLPAVITELITEVYPNPTTGRVNISLHNLNNPEVLVSVFNMSGSKVLEKSVVTDGLIELDLTGKVSGIYMLRLVADNQEFTRKIVLGSNL